MRKSYSRGSAAPLALLFTLVSMSFTVAYLQNSFSQSAMEKYRYAEWAWIAGDCKRERRKEDKIGWEVSRKSEAISESDL